MTQHIQLAERRGAWLLLALSALALEASALWFQYGMQLDPCVMCVYERLAVFGILFAGLLGLLQPRFALLRWAGFLLWGVSAAWGLRLAMEHVGFQSDSTAALNCSFLPEFPAWMPLHEWMPGLFLPTGYCDEIQWQWLSLSMPQWMIVVFGIYLLVLAGVLLHGWLSRSG